MPTPSEERPPKEARGNFRAPKTVKANQPSDFVGNIESHVALYWSCLKDPDGSLTRTLTHRCNRQPKGLLGGIKGWVDLPIRRSIIRSRQLQIPAAVLRVRLYSAYSGLAEHVRAVIPWSCPYTGSPKQRFFSPTSARLWLYPRPSPATRRIARECIHIPYSHRKRTIILTLVTKYC